MKPERKEALVKTSENWGANRGKNKDEVLVCLRLWATQCKGKAFHHVYVSDNDDTILEKIVDATEEDADVFEVIYNKLVSQVALRKAFVESLGLR